MRIRAFVRASRRNVIARRASCVSHTVHRCIALLQRVGRGAIVVAVMP
jgi:hypothetical protein